MSRKWSLTLRGRAKTQIFVPSDMWTLKAIGLQVLVIRQGHRLSLTLVSANLLGLVFLFVYVMRSVERSIEEGKS